MDGWTGGGRGVHFCREPTLTTNGLWETGGNGTGRQQQEPRLSLSLLMKSAGAGGRACGSFFLSLSLPAVHLSLPVTDEGQG